MKRQSTEWFQANFPNRAAQPREKSSTPSHAYFFTVSRSSLASALLSEETFPSFPGSAGLMGLTLPHRYGIRLRREDAKEARPAILRLPFRQSCLRIRWFDGMKTINAGSSSP